MKKLWVMLVAVLMVISLSLQPAQVQGAAAAKTISVYVDGVKLNPLQAPTMIQGRTMLPMRAIFEAFNARILWNQQTKTVTAIRDDITVILKVGSKTATVNNQSVALDVPAQLLSGTTMVPVRFVSETLGAEVFWNQETQTVNIVTSNPVVNAVSYVTAQNVGKNGDGRDLQVSFPKVDRESDVTEYRVLIVKSSNAYNFTLSQALSSGYYTSVRPSGINQVVNLSSQSRDVNGDVLKANQSYNAYVLTIGKKGANALSGMSQSVTLTPAAPSVSAVSSIKVSTVNNYGDGRDVSVSFNQPQNASNIQNYRVMVVKTKDASSFDLNAANALSSSNYTTVNKTNSTTVTTTLSSSARDTSGEYIKTGVSYYVYVISVTNSSNFSSQLSSASSAFSLTTSLISAPVITKVETVSNYGDGRDLMVRFDRSSDESRVGSYRIFVVKDSKASSFNLSTATSLSSSYYNAVNKTGYNINQTLSSGSRDVDGSLLVPGITYRVFVMAVGTGSYSGNYALSGVSSSIVLYGNSNVYAATNVNVSDVSDYGDGRDLRVSFTRAVDESNLNGYRIMVVKSVDANYFTLSQANSLSSYYYTDVYKTGYNISQTLSSSARDVNGDLIKNGVSYRVFVLSVGAYGNNNTLSSYSSAITLLSSNSSVYPATSVAASTASSYGDYRDLRVSFFRASDESNLSGYRIMVVKSDNVNNFNLSRANNVSNYTSVNKGYNVSQIPLTSAKDVDGNLISNGNSYCVFVLSVGAYGNNALSLYSSAVTVSNNASADQVKNISVKQVAYNGDYRDLEVSFDRPNESNLSGYRIFVVKDSANSSFNLSQAESLNSSYYTTVSKLSPTNNVKLTGSNAYGGDAIKAGESYNVYVMSVGTTGYKNILSPASSKITLTKKDVAKVSGVRLQKIGDNGDGSDLQVTFLPVPGTDNDNIKEYRIMIIPAGDNLDLATASAAGNFTFVDKTTVLVNKPLDGNAKDIYNQVIKGGPGQSYEAYVLSVGTDGRNALAGPSNKVALPEKKIDYIVGPAEIVNAVEKDGSINVTFNKATNDNGTKQYKVMVALDPQTLDEAAANKAKYSVPVTVTSNGANFSANLQKDYSEADLIKGGTYNIYVLSVGEGGKFALSAPVNITLKKSDQGNSGNPDQGTPGDPPVTTIAAVKNLKATDAGDSQMEISFKQADDGIKEYHLLIVDAADASAPDLTVEDALQKKDFTQVTPNGKDFDKKTIDTTKDTDGKTLSKNKPYKVYVLSVANKGKSQLAGPVNVELKDDPAAAQKITAKWNNNGQIEVNFKKPADEGKVQQYAVLVVPTSTKANLKFDFQKKDDPRFKIFNVNEQYVNEQYVVTFSPDDKDINNAVLTADKSYNVYVVSIAKSQNGIAKNVKNSKDANVWSDPVLVTKAEDTNKEKNDQQKP